MQKFEYSVVVLRHPEAPAEALKQAAALNVAGADGWELVGITPASSDYRIFYFKRPVGK